MTAENLVLITIDALRHDALSCVGSSYASTPNLDALAAGGVLFEQAISNGPRTQSSFPSIMASLYPLIAGERRPLPSRATTLAQAASDAGLTTAGFNPSNPFLTRETGYDRGFDIFIDFWDVHERFGAAARRRTIARLKKRVHDAIGRKNLGFLMLMQALLLEEGGQFLTGDIIADQAREWLKNRTGRFFLWLHFMDVHFPYQPLPGQRTWPDRLSYVRGMTGLATGRPESAYRTLKRLYGQRVNRVDAIVGNVIDGLNDMGLNGTTAVVVTSDHGEQLGDRGRWAHGPDLHEELIRVPLIVSSPGMKGPVRINRQVQLLDLAPTVLDILGIPTPPTFLGSSFAPPVGTELFKSPEIIFSEAMHSGGRLSRSGVPDSMVVTSCRRNGWKYIRDTEDGTEELYDLDRDPGEQRNLIAERPREAAEMRLLLNGHETFLKREAPRYDNNEDLPTTIEDEEMRKRLAALGYL